LIYLSLYALEFAGFHLFHYHDDILSALINNQERNRLEVYVYEEDDCNLFVHHDFEVPAFPLSMAWMNVDPRQPGA
jgi:periodic tryptophan protein 1